MQEQQKPAQSWLVLRAGDGLRTRDPLSLPFQFRDLRALPLRCSDLQLGEELPKHCDAIRMASQERTGCLNR